MGDLTTHADRRPIGSSCVGSGYLQAWHLRWFREHLPASGVTLRNLSDEWGGIAHLRATLAGAARARHRART